MEKLKPCPFCGGKAFLWNLGYERGCKISCEKDCVTMPTRHDVFFETQEEAIKAWNTRTQLPAEEQKKCPHCDYYFSKV